MSFKLVLAFCLCVVVEVGHSVLLPQSGLCPDKNVPVFPPDIMNIEWNACYHTDCVLLPMMTCLKIKLAARRGFKYEMRLEYRQKHVDRQNDIDEEVGKDIGDVKEEKKDGKKDYGVDLDNQKTFPVNIKAYDYNKDHKFLILYSCKPMGENVHQLCTWILSPKCKKVDQDFMAKHYEDLKAQINATDDNFLKTDWNACR